MSPGYSASMPASAPVLSEHDRPCVAREIRARFTLDAQPAALAVDFHDHQARLLKAIREALVHVVPSGGGGGAASNGRGSSDLVHFQVFGELRLEHRARAGNVVLFEVRHDRAPDVHADHRPVGHGVVEASEFEQEALHMRQVVERGKRLPHHPDLVVLALAELSAAEHELPASLPP